MIVIKTASKKKRTSQGLENNQFTSTGTRTLQWVTVGLFFSPPEKPRKHSEIIHMCFCTLMLILNIPRRAVQHMLFNRHYFKKSSEHQSHINLIIIIQSLVSVDIRS